MTLNKNNAVNSHVLVKPQKPQEYKFKPTRYYPGRYYVDDWVRDTFQRLTRFTTPSPHDYYMYDKLLVDELGCTMDKWGNYFVNIGSNSNTMFACHLDTADAGLPKEVKHQYTDDGIVSTDGHTLLGADDKAGMTVLMWLIHCEVPGHYAFFVGEEIGRVGSSKYTVPKRINKVICFDRYGYDSIITHQMWERSCSEKFARALIDELDMGFQLDPDGSYTDSYSFINDVPECTNISVGYENAHSVREYQDLEFLTELCHTVTAVNWDGLPIERDPSKTEWGDDGYYGTRRYRGTTNGSYAVYDDEYEYYLTKDSSWNNDDRWDDGLDEYYKEYAAISLPSDQIFDGVMNGRITKKQLEHWVRNNVESAAQMLIDTLRYG